MMRTRSLRLALAVTAAGFLSFAIGSSRLPAQEKKPAAAKAAKSEEVTGGADQMLHSWGPRKITLMTGSVHFEHGETRFLSERIEYDDTDAKNPVATSPGKLRISSPDSDVTGDKGVAYFAKRTGIVQGNVVMVLKPKKSAQAAAATETDKQNLREQPTTVTCPKLEYNYKKKIAVATGGVVFRQPNRSMTADKAIYDQNKEFLVLTGNVSAIDEKGQKFSAPGKVEVSIKEGDEWMRAEKTSATFRIDVEDEE